MKIPAQLTKEQAKDLRRRFHTRDAGKALSQVLYAAAGAYVLRQILANRAPACRLGTNQKG